MPKSYTPNWFFTALLDNHINQMMARYSCLRALRMDFFYRKDTPDFLQPDHRWLELQLRMLLEQVEQFENIVGFFWVIEWTADHGFHAHAVFWIDRQRVKKYIPLRSRKPVASPVIPAIPDLQDRSENTAQHLSPHSHNLHKSHRGYSDHVDLNDRPRQRVAACRRSPD